MPMTAETNDFEIISKECLLFELRNAPQKLIILDCRSSNAYEESHIRDAVNFSIPSIMLRRLAAGKIDLLATIKNRDLKNRLAATFKECTFVLYNENIDLSQNDATLNVLLKKLLLDGCRVVCLEGSFSDFRQAFPEWCESCSQNAMDGSEHFAVGQDQLPLMGLRSLRISTAGGHVRPPPLHYDSLSSAANSSTDSSDTDERCDSSLGLEEDKDFPVEILPYLYLGNAANSEDSQALERHRIQYVLNVTPDLPNVFEDKGHIKYMQIPITDHWSQNLAVHFPSAIEFIDEARSRNKGILVHCLAGISRSVTITVAYLMYRCSLNMNDAFNLVRARKANIAPNFNFMEQLLRFEKELKLDVESEDPQIVLENMRKESEIAALGGMPVSNKNRIPLKQIHAKKWSCQTCGVGVECKCPSSTNSSQSAEYLSPFGTIGVSPDSGIEFDRWSGGGSGLPSASAASSD